MAHTPEPWVALCLNPGPNAILDVCRDNGDFIASEIHGNSREERVANAYVIAAAPQLRRFAQEIAALDPQDFDAHMGEALIRRARALVVKADGAT